MPTSLNFETVTIERSGFERKFYSFAVPRAFAGVCKWSPLRAVWQQPSPYQFIMRWKVTIDLLRCFVDKEYYGVLCTELQITKYGVQPLCSLAGRAGAALHLQSGPHLPRWLSGQ